MKKSTALGHPFGEFLDSPFRLTAYFFSFALMLSCAGGRGTVSQESAIQYLLPKPQEMIKEPGAEHIVSASTAITIDAGLDERETECGKVINDALSRMNLVPLRIVHEAIPSDVAGIVIGEISNPAIRKDLPEPAVRPGRELPMGGYILYADAGRIIIAANTPEGRFNGTQTLIQLLIPRKDNTAAAPGIFIRDFPDYEIRGFIDDISHGQISTELDFKHIVRTMGRYKMNAYFLYIDDMFTPTAYPLIGAQKGAFSAQMIKNLSAEAARYHVRLAPVFPWPGGHEDILAIPEYSTLGIYPGASCFDISKPETKTFFTRYYSELLQAFTGEFAVMDGREDADNLAGFLKSKQFEAAEIETLFMDYVHIADSLAASTGKRLYLFPPDFLRKNAGIISESIGLFEDAETEQLPPRNDRERRLKIIGIEEAGRLIPAYTRFFGALPAAAKQYSPEKCAGLIPQFMHARGKEFLRGDGWIAYLYGAAEGWKAGSLNEGEYIGSLLHHHYRTDNHRIEEPFRLFLDYSNPHAGAPSLYEEFWEIPFARMHSELEVQALNESTGALRALSEQLSSILEDDDSLREGMSSILLALDQEIWTAKKMDYQRKIHDLDSLMRAGKGVKSTPTEIRSFTSDLIRDLYSFRDAFRKMWMASNQEPGMEFQLRRFGDLVSVLDEKIGRIREEDFSWNPLLPSRWINGSAARPGDDIFFRKEFSARGDIEAALMQVKCCPHAEIYLNGQLIGAVSSGAYDSPDLLHSSVSIVNLLPYIKEGRNCIGIKISPVATMEAGIHAFCEIRYRNYSADSIATDASWSYSDTEYPDWFLPDFGDAGWTKASVPELSFAEILDFYIPNINRFPAKK